MVITPPNPNNPVIHAIREAVIAPLTFLLDDSPGLFFPALETVLSIFGEDPEFSVVCAIPPLNPGADWMIVTAKNPSISRPLLRIPEGS
jgi:hypothetical protein